MAAIQRRALPAPRAFGRALGRPLSGRLLAFIAIALLVGIAMAQVNQFSRMASTGYELEALRRERAAKQAENHELERRVAELSSLARVDWEARVELGMVPPARTLNVEVNTAAPARTTLPTRFLPPAPAQLPPPENQPSRWERIRGLLPF
jgi:cell division protein FtsL